MAVESGQRASLKAAIVARDEAAERLEATKAALDRLDDRIFDARRRLHEARAAAVDERAARVRQIVAGGSATLLERVNGKASEDTIATEIEALQSAKELTQAAWREAAWDCDLAERRAKTAVLSVLAVGAPGLLKEAAAAKERFIGLTSILRFLQWGASDSLRQRIDAMSNFPTDFDRQEQHPLLVKWEACSEALTRDASAPLPDA
jgi:hypothetical protein